MNQQRRRRNERNPVRIITNEWVENNCVNVMPRDMEMLKLLTRFPLMNSEHLYLLTPGAGGQPPFYTLNTGRKRCNERIRALYDMHAINKVSPQLPVGEGTSKQYVWLDRAGVKLLNIERRIRHELPQDYKHQSLVLDTYCALVVGHREKDWQAKHLVTEVGYQSSGLIPDLTAILRRENKGTILFIEVDRSEKKESVEKAKLLKYKEWELSRNWVAEPWNQHLPKPYFPTVVYLFDESRPRWKRRLGVLQKYSEQIGLRSVFLGITNFRSYLIAALR